MKRRRTSAPGRPRPDGRWTHLLIMAAVVAVLVAACGQATSTDRPTEAPVSSEGVPPSGPATESPTEPPSAEPTATAESPDTEPGSSPTAGSSPDPTGGAGSAAACSGSDENRDFFASMAAAVDWTVYCPVLPDGWFVDDGQYRLANGGWMDISFDGPGDARVVLRQGAFCESAEGCVPAGSELGETAFADRSGTIVAALDGSWAIVVDRGAVPSWLLIVEGLDETEARAIAGDLVAVAG